MNSGRQKVLVREATIDDVGTIVAFNRALALETENKELDPAILTRGVEQALSQPALCRYFIAELGAEVVGQTMITYEWSDWRNGVFWWIQSVYVRESQRGSGVFRTLHEFISTLARAAPNVCGLRLTSTSTITRPWPPTSAWDWFPQGTRFTNATGPGL